MREGGKTVAAGVITNILPEDAPAKEEGDKKGAAPAPAGGAKPAAAPAGGAKPAAAPAGGAGAKPAEKKPAAPAADKKATPPPKK